MFTDYTYYTEEFLLGDDPVIPATSFPKWEKQAAITIDAETHGRASAMTVIPDALKGCTCAVAELLYKADQVEGNSLSQGIVGVLTSYSNDGQSGTYDISQSKYTETGKREEISRILRLYLHGTGLLYAGVDHYES